MRNIAYVKNQWISIDAYTSSTGIELTTSKTLTVSIELNYEGSQEIKALKNLKGSGKASYTMTKNVGITAAPWTYVAWRPYIAYREDNWYGMMEVHTVIPNATGVYEKTWYDPHTGTNRTKITEAIQSWDKVNTAHNRNAASPVPPSTPPILEQP